MIVQAIGLLDDLDKELNTYAMRVREWYGWHFPEMTKIVADNIKYAKAVSFLSCFQQALLVCDCVIAGLNTLTQALLNNVQVLVKAGCLTMAINVQYL